MMDMPKLKSRTLLHFVKLYEEFWKINWNLGDGIR